MARKRPSVSDVLREEAKRSPEDRAASESQAAKAAAKQPTNRQNSSQKTSKQQNPKQQNQPSQKSAPNPEPVASAIDTDTSASIQADLDQAKLNEAKLDETIATLNETIANLTSELEQVRHSEKSLHKEVTRLKTDWQTQEELVHQLKTDLDKAQYELKELQETKQLILTLSENNLRLSQELDSLKSKAAAQTKTMAPAPSPSASTLTPAAPPRPQQVQSRFQTSPELWRVLQHPVQAGLPSTDLSDADIGWFD